MTVIDDEVRLIRNYLSKVRIECKDRGEYEGAFFEKLWRIDNWTESALNTLIDLDNAVLIQEKNFEFIMESS